MERILERVDVISLAKVVGTVGLLWGIILAITWVNRRSRRAVSRHE
jgi:hypothetical protein